MNPILLAYLQAWYGGGAAATAPAATSAGSAGTTGTATDQARRRSDPGPGTKGAPTVPTRTPFEMALSGQLGFENQVAAMNFSKMPAAEATRAGARFNDAALRYGEDKGARQNSFKPGVAGKTHYDPQSERAAFESFASVQDPMFDSTLSVRSRIFREGWRP